MSLTLLDFIAVDNNIAIVNDQSTGGGNLLLNGDMVDNDGKARTGSEAYITFSITSTENLSGVNFTITGKEVGGGTGETLAGPNAGTVLSNSWYREITAVSVDGAIAADIQIGWLTTGNSMFATSLIVNHRQSPSNMSIAALKVSGTGTFNGLFGVQDPQADYPTSFYDDSFGLPIPGLTGITDTTHVTLDFPVTALWFDVDADPPGEWKVVVLQGQNG